MFKLNLIKTELRKTHEKEYYDMFSLIGKKFCLNLDDDTGPKYQILDFDPINEIFLLKNININTTYNKLENNEPFSVHRDTIINTINNNLRFKIIE